MQSCVKNYNTNIDNSKVVIFGGGRIGVIAAYIFKYKHIEVLLCMDNDSQKQGKMLWNHIPCQTPKLYNEEIPVVLTVEDENVRAKIRCQCSELGYKYIYDIDRESLDMRIKELPDEEFITLQYHLAMKGKYLDLQNPVTYNEKLQWLKLYDHRPEYHLLVDKYEVKKYVAEKIGEKYVIPTLGVWERFDEIDFEALPNQFVLKCTHDCGSIVICKNKEEFNIQEAKFKIEKAQKSDFYLRTREWVYKDIAPRILAEPYMEDAETKELRDYKFFMFDGQAKAIFIAQDRCDETEETKFDFYDMDFNHLNFTNGHPNASVMHTKPKVFEKMRMLAEHLSENIPHVRVDFYIVNGKIYFGELTFYHWGGLVPFEPEKWDYIFGEWINLPR